MQHNVFSVYDSKADVYGPLVLAPALGAAKRSFIETCRDSSTTLARHPEDFSLYHLGTFDDSTGELFSLKAPKLVLSASEALESI